ncbi:GNAT family N-acetyltransferase [Olsenella sp. HMSC062G07]|uniref:lipid II:glycine glycyltransferase FemX n=1 Tax=Olsenella sp. HMSC062G07 TaxID=1739330 RepID=UPI0008A3BCBF|nr:GNAT family N-acetyltransferase [Olsenella sp. HMSC062G07]OFK24774.1 peptidoglycan bridge formation protein FemAB [Olsenella sp. HMSC062G07]
MDIRQIDFARMEELAREWEVDLPIEQTQAWARYQKTIEDRTPWRCLELVRDGCAVAVLSLTDFETHGYHYLRSWHGPVWGSEPGEELERTALEALRDYVRGEDGRVAFVRLAVAHELDVTRPVLSTRPYNQTVVIDTTGTPEEILQRFKKRGRRDVRKSLRECKVAFADETALARSSFAEHYDVMVETGARDGFTPAPLEDYENFIRILGEDHCRVFAGRLDGQVVTWTIATIQGTHAVRYYGASRTGLARTLATDGLIYFECCELARRGCTSYDQMGIGNDFSPTLKGLNTFKTKFAEGVTDVAPARDLPVRPVLYGSLVAAKKLLRRG